MNRPFKFLDAFEAEDRDSFFGREREVEELYALVLESELTLVFGTSGTGKTSIIQCGLANRFPSTNWHPIFVRRGDDLNVALDRALRAQGRTPIPPDAPTREALRSLYLDIQRPLYLVLDQFEEIYVLGSEAEQERFYTTVSEILAGEVSCRIIISLREEYLAALTPFEAVVPRLFDARLRVETMRPRCVIEAIMGMTAAAGITLEHGEATAQLIVDQLDDQRVGVQLTYLQVYLDALYRRAAHR